MPDHSKPEPRSEERRLRDLRYLRKELEREERAKSQVVQQPAQHTAHELFNIFSGPHWQRVRMFFLYKARE
ncbi:MAG TPA: hypothetical protein VG714_07925 [Acidobacteriaceae bacterium]|nr:hypothetical protein [Acidobacteriaceae bacterium]